MNLFEIVEMQLEHRKFYDWCCARVQEAIDQSLLKVDELTLPET